MNCLDGYALPTLLDRFHYARPGIEIKSFFREKKKYKMKILNFQKN